jgi:hypothetical protein
VHREDGSVAVAVANIGNVVWRMIAGHRAAVVELHVSIACARRWLLAAVRA